MILKWHYKIENNYNVNFNFNFPYNVSLCVVPLSDILNDQTRTFNRMQIITWILLMNN